MREGAITVTIGLGGSFFTGARKTSAPPASATSRHSPATPSTPPAAAATPCVLIASDEPADALTRFGTSRWQQHGTHTPTGALGFRDGTMNPRRPLDFDRHVWVTQRERTWMLGGTFLVVRDIRVNDTWRTLGPAQQERTIGRDKRTGAPLGGRKRFEKPDLERLPADAHIRVASPRTSGVTILRRGFDTDDGLLLLAFQKDPRRQFVPLQHRLAAEDALHPHTTAIGSAVFAIPSGAERPHGLAHSLLYAQ